MLCKVCGLMANHECHSRGISGDTEYVPFGERAKHLFEPRGPEDNWAFTVGVLDSTYVILDAENPHLVALFGDVADGEEGYVHDWVRRLNTGSEVRDNLWWDQLADF